MTIGSAEIAMIWLAGSTMATTVFYTAFLLGKLYSRMDRNESRIAEIDHTLDSAGQKMSDLANKVQTMPERFLTRQEAMTWRGSRVEDPR